MRMIQNRYAKAEWWGGKPLSHPVPNLRSNKPCSEVLWMRWVVAVQAATFGDKCLISLQRRGMTTCRLRSKTKCRQHGTIQHQKQYLKQRQRRSIPNNSLSTCIYQIEINSKHIHIYIYIQKYVYIYIYVYISDKSIGFKKYTPILLQLDCYCFFLQSQDAQSDAFTKIINFEAQTLQFLTRWQSWFPPGPGGCWVWRSGNHFKTTLIYTISI